jgi:hypothetical protein
MRVAHAGSQTGLRAMAKSASRCDCKTKITGGEMMYRTHLEWLERELMKKIKLRKQLELPTPLLDEEIEALHQEIWRVEREEEQIRRWGRLK